MNTPASGRFSASENIAIVIIGPPIPFDGAMINTTTPTSPRSQIAIATASHARDRWHREPNKHHENRRDRRCGALLNWRLQDVVTTMRRIRAFRRLGTLRHLRPGDHAPRHEPRQQHLDVNRNDLVHQLAGEERQRRHHQHLQHVGERALASANCRRQNLRQHEADDQQHRADEHLLHPTIRQHAAVSRLKSPRRCCGTTNPGSDSLLQKRSPLAPRPAPGGIRVWQAGPA